MNSKHVVAIFAVIILISVPFSSEVNAQYQRPNQEQFQGKRFQGTSTPVNGTTYTNDKFGIQISIPSGWSGIEMKRTSGATTVILAPGGFQFGQGVQRPPVTISLSMIPTSLGSDGQHFGQGSGQRGFDTQSCTNSTSTKAINNLNYNEVIIKCNGNTTTESQSDRIQTGTSIISMSLRADSSSDFDAQSTLYQTMLDTLHISSSNTQNAVIPSWVKKNAGWWSSGSLADSDFVSGIQYLVQQGVMKIPQTTNSPSANSTTQIPTWIKKNAGWWADGQLTDDDFVKAIQYLISNQIIKLQ